MVRDPFEYPLPEYKFFHQVTRNGLRMERKAPKLVYLSLLIALVPPVSPTTSPSGVKLRTDLLSFQSNEGREWKLSRSKRVIQQQLAPLISPLIMSKCPRRTLLVKRVEEFSSSSGKLRTYELSTIIEYRCDSNFNHERWTMCCASARSQRSISKLLILAL